jgi:translocation and assembly module TamA
MRGVWPCSPVPRLAALLFLLCLGWAVPAWAHTLDIAVNVTGDDATGKELKALVEETEKGQGATDSAGALQRARTHLRRLTLALRSKGFYGASIAATIAGRPVDDPATLDALEALPPDQKLSVVLTVETGPVFRMAKIDIRGVSDIERKSLRLAPGDPADAARILGAEEDVLAQLRKRGHALAAVGKREAVVDHATQEVDVTYVFIPGPTAKMGSVTFEGSESIDMVFLQRRVPFKQGEPYDPDKVKKLRDRIGGLGVFSAVRVKSAPELDANGELPIAVELKDRPPRTIGFGAGYETRRGFAVNGYWLHRNLFGQAESVRLSAELNNIGRGGIDSRSLANTGFALSAAFLKPDWWLAGQDAKGKVELLREILDTYRRRATVVQGGLERRISPQWRAAAGFNLEYSIIERLGSTRNYQLLGIPLSVAWDRTDSELEPTRGFRLDMKVTPYLDFGEAGKPFAILRLTGSTYVDVLGGGRTVLAARASIGSIPGVRTDTIPPDKLFYAGGGGSVRGFAYQSAGPRDALLTPTGGASVIEGSLELRQRIGDSFGVVAFIDVGSAYPGKIPDFALSPRIGAGIGARYYTDFGPIRADIGFPLNRRAGDDHFGLYISLGQAF